MDLLVIHWSTAQIAVSAILAALIVWVAAGGLIG